MDDDDLYRRAMAAYWRGRVGDPGVDQPAQRRSGVEEHGGKKYVVLRGDGVLAVYRVRNDGMLKGLKRWPRHWSAADRATHRGARHDRHNRAERLIRRVTPDVFGLLPDGTPRTKAEIAKAPACRKEDLYHAE